MGLDLAPPLIPSLTRQVKKVDTHVAFPFSFELDVLPPGESGGPPKHLDELKALRPSCCRYGLYGVVEHSGTSRNGHYTAFVRTPATPPRWHRFNDSTVSSVTEEAVAGAQSFLLFYRRLDAD